MIAVSRFIHYDVRNALVVAGRSGLDVFDEVAALTADSCTEEDRWMVNPDPFDKLFLHLVLGDDFNTTHNMNTVFSTVPMSNLVVQGFKRETDITHGSPAWYSMRAGKTIGSSECAKVFTGIVSGSARKELENKFKGKEKPAVSAYSQHIMDQGTKMEPHLLSELSAWFVILRANLYTLPTLTHGVQEMSTPDAIGLVDFGGQHRLTLIEIKWRPTSPDDAGWGPSRNRLGFSQWCQAQHQMHLTGIHKCLLYAGAPSGARRGWSIDYCPEFRAYFLLALEACAQSRRFDSKGTSEVKLGRMLALTTRAVYVSLPRTTTTEIKGGPDPDEEATDDDEETVETSEEALGEDLQRSWTGLKSQ